MRGQDLINQNRTKDYGITVPDNWRPVCYDIKHFAIPPHYQPYLDCVMLSRGMVLDRTEKLGIYYFIASRALASMPIFGFFIGQ